jgi:hypothetical protein
VLASVALYACLLLALAGALAVARPVRRLRMPTRRRAALVLAAGASGAASIALLPAPTTHADGAESRLDAIAPTWQFGEHHETLVHASPARVDAAIHAVTAREIRFFLLLTGLRNPLRLLGRQRPSILAPPADEPILAVALRSGFLSLADEPGRELVFGSIVVAPRRLARLPPEELARRRAALTAARFAALDAPGFVKAAMNFRLADAGDGWTRLTTETRVFATDPGVRRRFGVYWRLIYPGSALIRRQWLDAIRRRAEQPETPVPR